MKKLIPILLLLSSLAFGQDTKVTSLKAKNINGTRYASQYAAGSTTGGIQEAINEVIGSGSAGKPKSCRIIVDNHPTITATINVSNCTLTGLGWGSSTDSVPNGYIRWGGAAGIPMIKVGGQGSEISNLRLVGDSGNAPSAAIEVSQTAPSGTQSNYTTIKNVWIGYTGYDTNGGLTGQFTNGIEFTGTVNNDTNYIEKVNVVNVANACLKFTNNQASDTHINTFSCYGSPFGVWTAADIIGTNWFFSGTTTSAIYVETQGSVHVIGISGEGNTGALLQQKSGSRAYLDNDGWQMENGFAPPNGYVIDAAISGDDCAGYTETVLRNFDFKMTASPALPYYIHWGNAGNNCRQGGELILDFVGGIEESNLSLAGTGTHAWDLRKVFLRKKPDGNGDAGTVAQNVLHAGETFDQYRTDILGKLNVWAGTLRTKQDPIQLVGCTATGGTGTTYSYKVWGKSGAYTSAVQTCTVSGNASLDASHYNTISIAPTGRGYDTYCVAGRSAGAELQIACVRAGTMSDPSSANYSWKFVDDGTVTPSGAVPTGASVGRIESEGGIYTDTIDNLAGAGMTAKGNWTFQGDIANSAAGRTVTTTKVVFPNCASGASPAVCTSSASGRVALPAGGTTLVVNTTAVAAASLIFIQEDTTQGTALSVTCNTTAGRKYAVTARTAATSFTITADAAPVTNPACLSYFIVN